MAAPLSGGRGLLGALADYVALTLGSGSKHCEALAGWPPHVGNARSKPLLSVSVAIKATLRLKRSYLETSKWPCASWPASSLRLVAVGRRACRRHEELYADTNNNKTADSLYGCPPISILAFRFLAGLGRN
jgi:hypothetical protein